jgi:hypothetical protein
MKNEVIPDVYVQDPKYFEDFTDDLKLIYGQGIGAPIDRVAIHVRRGDYVNNPFYVDLTQTDYYEKAMKEFPNKKFLVFSDDIEWCKYYFEGEEYEFCEVENDVEAMNIMAQCRGHIIANSSFSWWGAFISPYTEKVVAPKKWYSDGVKRTKCPKGWIKI